MKIAALERDLEKAASDFLALDGWRVLKQELNWSERKKKSVGEKGMPDRLYIRYGLTGTIGHSEAGAQVMWGEWKRVGGKPSAAQLKWHEIERARGALTFIAGVDFPATIEGLQVWYSKSGLQRNRAKVGVK